MSRFTTALDIVQQAAVRSGLPKPAVASGSTDALTAQLWSLLAESGQEMAKGYNWEQLQATYLFATAPGVTQYDLPADFDGFANSTAWNRTSRLPMIGPASPQDWQTLVARNLGGNTISLIYRQIGQSLVLYSSPSSAQQVAFEYKSRNWVTDATNPLVSRDSPINDGDIVMFDQTLMVAALRLKLRQEKGFDTTVQQQAFNDLFDAATARDTDAPVLSASHKSRYPLLGYLNIPDTNYGQI